MGPLGWTCTGLVVLCLTLAQTLRPALEPRPKPKALNRGMPPSREEIEQRGGRYSCSLGQGSPFRGFVYDKIIMPGYRKWYDVT